MRVAKDPKARSGGANLLRLRTLLEERDVIHTSFAILPSATDMEIEVPMSVTTGGGVKTIAVDWSERFSNFGEQRLSPKSSPTPVLRKLISIPLDPGTWRDKLWAMRISQVSVPLTPATVAQRFPALLGRTFYNFLAP